MNFPEPTEKFVMKGRGTIYITNLPVDISNEELKRCVGKTVILGDKPFRVDGVETYALTHLRRSTNLGLLGEYIK